jgi:hypothetical protein
MDAQGKVIRTYTGTPADFEKKAAAPAPAPEDFFRPQEPKAPVDAGIHRLNWDIRYPGAVDFPGMIMWAANSRGPVAPPGTYQVRVTADGESQTQPFAIRREPHVLAGVTDADLQKQFDLAMKVRNRASDANEAVLLVRGIKPQITDRAGKLDSKTGATAKALDDLEKTLSTVEGEIYQVKNQSGQDPLNYPIKLNNKIAALQGVVESADMPPTQQSEEVFDMLSTRLGAQLEVLDNTIKTKLPQVNQLLKKQKLAPIEAKPLDPKADEAKPKPIPQ